MLRKTIKDGKAELVKFFVFLQSQTRIYAIYLNENLNKAIDNETNK